MQVGKFVINIRETLNGWIWLEFFIYNGIFNTLGIVQYVSEKPTFGVEVAGIEQEAPVKKKEQVK